MRCALVPTHGVPCSALVLLGPPSLQVEAGTRLQMAQVVHALSFVAGHLVSPEALPAHSYLLAP